METTNSTSRQKFVLGRIVATPAALDALMQNGESSHGLLMRHSTGDWGDLCEGDKQANDMDLSHGGRLLSAYILRDGQTKIWVITEADRSSTCLLMPEEY